MALPTTKHDLYFEVVIEQCPMGYSLGSVSEIVHSDIDIISLPGSIKAKLLFFRVWCLYEIFYAAYHGKQIIVMGGCHESLPSSGRHRFVTNSLMLEKMASSVDISAAAASNPADRDMIFRKI